MKQNPPKINYSKFVITGTGSGDLLLEDAIDSGAGGKFLDSASIETDTHSQILQEGSGGGVILSEANDGLVADREVLVLNDSVANIFNGLEAEDHIVLEEVTTISGHYDGNKIVQEILFSRQVFTDLFRGFLLTSISPSYDAQTVFV